MIRDDHSRYPVVAQTHAGMSGKNNEDRFAVSAFHLNANDKTPSLFAVLCDGIGGHKAGEIAAELAANIISQTVAQSDGSDPQATLEQGFVLANQAVFAEASRDNGKQGMGSTAACVWLIGRQLYSATVGDSRIYLMHAGSIRQLSIDHTWIQEALDLGLLSPEEVDGHPHRHVIRRYLGAPQAPQVDFRLKLNAGEHNRRMQENQGSEIENGDRLLLCSDGLTDLVTDDEILAAFERKNDEKAVQSLIELANQRGGHDNITVIAIQIPETVKPLPKRRSFLPYGCAIGAILIGLLLVSALGYFLMRGFPWASPTETPTPPVQATINPLMTSAPQASVTLPPLPSRTPTPLLTATPTERPGLTIPNATGYPVATTVP